MARPLLKEGTRGLHRAAAPEETLARVRPHLAAMGITRVANVTGLDRLGIPVAMASRPNARSVSVSQGKGLTLEAAKTSAVMEALETWHAERISHPLRHARLSDLRREGIAADVTRLPRTKSSRFTDETSTLWVEGTDLATRMPQWLPYEMVHTDYTVPFPPGHGQFHASSNGLASGNEFLEAVCHAICELIERDATTLWHQLPARTRRRTGVRPETVDDPACLDAMRRIAAARMTLGIFETTSDVGVACFRCLLLDGDRADGHIGIGDGCHPHRGIALLRAITEAAQTRMTYISGARDDITPDEFADRAMTEKHRFVRETIGGSPPSRDFRDAPHLSSASFDEDFEWLAARLRQVGCAQVITVDLTRPEIGIPVVRVVIPGLEAPHDDDTYLPGERARAAGVQLS